VQTRYLRDSLEWHLLGNHLLANAKALVFAGSFFAGPEAHRWRKAGLGILARELPEQILADGGHFELSPMYHAIVLEDVLDLINLAATFPDALPLSMVRRLQATGKAMQSWLAAMLHPDGKIPFFNDAAFGIAANFAQLDGYARHLGLGSAPLPADGVTHLKASGYVRVQQPDVVALLDVGRVGPDYLPGHAHADTLSFELSLLGARLIVNSGTSVYAEGHERARQRGTAAHSTLTLDDEDSSEVWGAFRVARRAHPIGLQVSETRDRIVVACGHDGYGRLAMPATHYRSWAFEDRRVTVEDTIEGTPHRAVARFYLAPDVGVRMHNSYAELTLGSGRKTTCRIEGGTLKAGQSTWHPEFGSAIPNTVLLAEFDGLSCSATFTW
jgi:uncharacterized heparinase superfamily protein